ncbi:hypothetical protein JRQ81_011503 [Phrynocephalus forsythii]|uniref:Immunoglobulin V-set domain-containing protein n=1 Tax=Phrynocephalus forsythii TaxID=171643 RepID=A0A9Q1AQM2_9SAUR|nr:hypothetical protein JRQ81_011503 [Phrynocephalus forsythii]
MLQMFPPPRAAKKSQRCSPSWWPMLLLTALILCSTCITQSQAADEAKVQIIIDPSHVLAGMDVNLFLKGSTKEIKSCTWYRGHRLKQFAILTYQAETRNVTYNESYTGRERVQQDCSLYIKNVTISDTDFYSIRRVLEGGLVEFGTVPLLVRGWWWWNTADPQPCKTS